MIVVIVAGSDDRLFNVIVIVVEPVCTTGAVKALLPVIELTVSVLLAASYATPPKLPAGIVLAVVAVAVTGTVIVHDVAPAPTGAGPRLPPVSVTEVAVFVSTPLQVVDGAPETVIVAAQLSVNVIGVRMLALKLSIVIVIVDGAPPAGIGFGANDFASRAPVWTVMVRLIAGLVAPSAVVNAPAAIVFVGVAFVNTFGLRAMTSTRIVHEPPAEIVPPARAIVAGLLAVAVAVPLPQVVAAFGVGAMLSVAGSVSMIAALVSGTGLGFVSVIVSVDTGPLPWTLVGAKILLPVMLAGAETTSVACASCGFVPCDDATEPAAIVLR